MAGPDPGHSHTAAVYGARHAPPDVRIKPAPHPNLRWQLRLGAVRIQGLGIRPFFRHARESGHPEQQRPFPWPWTPVSALGYVHISETVMFSADYSSSPRKRGPRGTPAKSLICGPWVPAFAGMTGKGTKICTLPSVSAGATRKRRWAPSIRLGALEREVTEKREEIDG